MKRRVWVLLLITLFSWSSMDGLRAADAAEMFLEGYSAFQAGEKLERDADFAEAIKKYRYAADLLNHISKQNPNWQPMVVGYRLEKVKEALDRVQHAAGGGVSSNAGPSALSQNASPTAGGQDHGVSERQMFEETISSRRELTAQDRDRAASDVRFPVTPSLGGRNGDRLENENSELRQQLTQRMAELKSALREVDKTRVTVVELRHELTNAKTQLNNLMQDRKVGNEVEAYYKEQIKDLEKQVMETEADRDVLVEENARLVNKLNQAVSYISASDAARQQLDVQHEALVKEKDAIVVDRDKVNHELESALKELEKTREQIKEIELLTQENEVLKKRLTEEERKITDLASLREQDLKKQQTIEQEKILLQQGLTKAQEQLATLETIAEQREQDVSTLRFELKAVSGRLENLRGDVNVRDNRIVELERQLDEAAGELAKLKTKAAPSGDDKKLFVENELLRGIILRQLREQARRDQARRLIEEEITRLKVKSETINKQLAAISKPVELTAEEKAIFRIPSILVEDTNPEEPEVSIAADKEGEPETRPADSAKQASASKKDSGSDKKTKSPGYEALPKEIQAKVDQAKTAYNRGDLAGAERMYQDAVNVLSDDYFVVGQLAAVQFEEGKLESAESNADRAIQLNPEDSFAYAIKGIACYRQSRFGDAEKSLRKAIDLKPTDARAHNYLGIVLSELGKSKDAEKTIQKALVLDPKYAEAHFNLAVLYATQTPPSKELAKRHYTAATELGAERDPSLEQLIQ